MLSETEKEAKARVLVHVKPTGLFVAQNASAPSRPPTFPVVVAVEV